MASKVKPVTRQEILSLAVTDVDPFGAQRYIRHREVVPRLVELEEQGQTVLPGPQGVLTDLEYSLWAPEPRLKEEGQIPADRRYWKELLGQAIGSSAYQELHGQTQLRELESVLGTIAMGENVLALVPKKDRENLQELEKAQQQADRAGQQAIEAQASADALQAMADRAQQAAGGCQPQSSESQPSGQPQAGFGEMTGEQAKALANELAQQATQALQDAKVAQELASEAEARAEALAEVLMGKPGSQQAADKQRELARIGLAAAKKAQEQVKEISNIVQFWGLEPGELTRESFAEVQQILAQVQRNPNLKKFSSLLGRLRQIAARKARSKDRGEGVRVTRMETGRDLKRAVPSELIALVNPVLRVKAITRWQRGELRLRGQEIRRKLGHGPVVVCEDASGSMDGVKQQWTKALVLALAYYAKLQKRSFGWVMFDYAVHQSKSYPQGNLSARDLLEIAESRAGGGTNFEAPLGKALEMIRKEGLKKADILLVTDGDCAVSDAFLKELLAVKKALEVSIYTVLVNVGETTDATVKEFSDRVVPISELTTEEAEGKVISLL